MSSTLNLHPLIPHCVECLDRPACQCHNHTAPRLCLVPDTNQDELQTSWVVCLSRKPPRSNTPVYIQLDPNVFLQKSARVPQLSQFHGLVRCTLDDAAQILAYFGKPAIATLPQVRIDDEVRELADQDDYRLCLLHADSRDKDLPFHALKTKYASAAGRAELVVLDFDSEFGYCCLGSWFRD